MTGHSYVYDIRTSEYARCTLVNFTGVDLFIWEKYIQFREHYGYDEELVADVIAKHGKMPARYEEWLFTYFHVTTSANKCKSFMTHGILDLKNAYSCPDSELREFLNGKGILIDIDNCLLKYRDYEYSITYGSTPPRLDSKAYACWSIGRRFYYDFTICGFLSVWEESAYGGNVHYRPEILDDIDNLLNLSLAQEWHLSHEAYEIVAMIPGSDIVCDSDDDQSEKDKILNYLTKAYNTAFGSPVEEVLLLKNNVQVLPQRIVEITPLRCWKSSL